MSCNTDCRSADSWRIFRDSEHVCEAASGIAGDGGPKFVESAHRGGEARYVAGKHDHSINGHSIHPRAVSCAYTDIKFEVDATSVAGL